MDKQFKWSELKLHDPNAAMFIGPDPSNQFELNMYKCLEGWDCRLIQHEMTKFKERLEPGKGIVLKEFHAESKDDAKQKIHSVVYDAIYNK